ncbi:hypothetical protein HDZ31DRAFT_66242 [Schizophyllum fasciatum]
MAELLALIGPAVTVVLRVSAYIPRPHSVAGHIKKEEKLLAEAYDLLDRHLQNIEYSQLLLCTDTLAQLTGMKNSLLNYRSIPQRWNLARISTAKALTAQCREARESCLSASNAAFISKIESMFSALLAAEDADPATEDFEGKNASQEDRIHDYIFLANSGAISNAAESDGTKTSTSSLIRVTSRRSVSPSGRAAATGTSNGADGMTALPKKRKSAGRKARRCADNQETLEQGLMALRARVHMVSTDLVEGAASMTSAMESLADQAQRSSSQVQAACRESLAQLCLDDAPVISFGICDGGVEALTGERSFTGRQLSDMVNEAASSEAAAEARIVEAVWASDSADQSTSKPPGADITTA